MRIYIVSWRTPIVCRGSVLLLHSASNKVMSMYGYQLQGRHSDASVSSYEKKTYSLTWSGVRFVSHTETYI